MVNQVTYKFSKLYFIFLADYSLRLIPTQYKKIVTVSLRLYI